MTPRAARAFIDTDALCHNLGVVRRYAPASRVLAMVKADAYGHGALRCALALEAAGADALGVVGVAGALRLREGGLRAPLVVLQGPRRAQEIAAFPAAGLQAVLHHDWQLEALAGWRGESLDAWLKFDTGMGRLGFAAERIDELLRRVAALPLRLQGLMTHLACADEPGNPHTAAQLRGFAELGAGRGLPLSVANSAGLVAWPAARLDWVRCGIMLYGASPFAAGHPLQSELRPVMNFESRLIAVNRHRAGDSIGYGATWRCPRDLDLGLVAVGYADGYPRAAPSGTAVLVNGQRAPLAGRVSMDSLAVDLGDIAAVPGDPVRLWGDGLPVNEIATAAGTIGYELLTRVRAEALRAAARADH